MKTIKIIILIFFVVRGYSQQVTFQGKLFENNQPVTGNRSVEFFIGNPINWTETHSVQINNGLYAVVLGSINPLPLNLFTSAVNSRELVVRINSNPVDTVTIYAPFERDYTVPDYIKDGISWSEISNKPNVDTSNTNELQTLSISNNVLSISQGNSVALPAGGVFSNQNVTVYGNLTVVDTVAQLAVSQTNQTSTSSVQSVWQSFMANANGRLRKIQLNFGLSANNYVTVKIYPGIGNSQQALGLLVVSGVSNIQQSQTLDISSMLPPITLQSGGIYTFEISAPIGNTLSIQWANNNPYQYGYCSFATNADLLFSLYIDNSSPACLTFDNKCYMGVGTNTPTSQLTVAGRIEDQTGFVMPVGSIIAYGGALPPKGWLVCDGSPIDRVTYSELFGVLGTSFGYGDQQYTFNLPDLRGRFLRGVDLTANNDPDKSSRIPINPGGNSGNSVGSLQTDSIKSHFHYGNRGDGNHWFDTWNNGWSGASSGCVEQINNSTCYNGSADGTSSTGGAETRPKNVYVNYIIKY